MRTEPRVLLDATAIPAERGGVGRYVDNLAEALDAAGAALSVVCQNRDAETFARLAPHSRIIPTAEELGSRPARLAWEQTTLSRLAKRLPVDVIHSPHYTMPLAASVPVVVTLHDATFFSDRGLHLGVKGRFFRAWTRTSLRRAAVCVVPSRATATSWSATPRPSRTRWWSPTTASTEQVFRVPRPDADRRRRRLPGPWRTGTGSPSSAPWSRARTSRRWSGPTSGR